MSAGYPSTAADINNKAGGLVVACWKSLDDLHEYFLWLNQAAHNDAFLTAAGMTGSSSSGDIKTLRDSIADLGGASGLWAVAHGSFTPAGANNYFANASGITGTTYTG